MSVHKERPLVCVPPLPNQVLLVKELACFQWGDKLFHEQTSLLEPLNCFCCMQCIFRSDIGYRFLLMHNNRNNSNSNNNMIFTHAPRTSRLEAVRKFCRGHYMLDPPPNRMLTTTECWCRRGLFLTLISPASLGLLSRSPCSSSCKTF